MALKPEFISLLRDIRDRIYPELNGYSTTIATQYNDIQIWYPEIVTMYNEMKQIEADYTNLSMGAVETVIPNPDGSHGIAIVTFDSASHKFNMKIPAGSNGIQGNIGLTGPQGVQGLTGIKGDTGSIGITGSQGSTGAQGQQGIQGIQGLTGIRGETGPTGTGINLLGTDTVTNIRSKPSTVVSDSWLCSDSGTDDDGRSVSQGDVLRATGAKWINVGPITGPAGAQGIQGDTGAQGNNGVDGTQGIQGNDGPQGTKGDIGAQGIQGIQGDTGIQGEAGPKGDKGETGDTGLKGDTGTVGPTGPAVTMATTQETTDGTKADAAVTPLGLLEATDWKKSVQSSPVSLDGESAVSQNIVMSETAYAALATKGATTIYFLKEG